ncbi:MAG: AMP-binding protein, partial [Acidobacteria bacterium]|nr:AMP-binding protein [Acidobacteriota bacterium]
MLSYPPRELWPEKIYSLPELAYPEKLNACEVLLDKNVEAGRGSSPAIFFGGQVITYAELLDEVIWLAGTLEQRGIHRGDRVILRLLNRPHFISIWLALLRLGAVVVATPPLIKAREILAIIDSCKPALLLSEPDLWDEVAKLGSALGGHRPPLQMETLSVGAVREAQARQRAASSDGRPIPASSRRVRETGRDDLAIISYTSGSTGVPKGCMHSHADLLATTDTYARCVLKPTPDDRFGGHPTMAFVYGLGGLLLFPFRFGASTVLLDRFTPEALVETIHRHKVTIAFCAPTSLRMMMRQGEALRAAVASLRAVVTAGETLPASVYDAWKELTGVEPLDGLGSTEMLHIFISSFPGRSRAGATGEG